MKLSLAALALAHLAKVFPATAQLTSNFTLQQIYYTNSEDGPISDISAADQLGGGFIVGDFLYLVAGSEDPSGTLFEVPLVRNETQGKIQGMDFNNSRVVFATEYLDLGFKTGGLDAYRWYSIVPDDDYYPDMIGYGTYDAIAKTFTEDGRIPKSDFEALNKTDPLSDIEFTGLLGIDFSPVVNDPGTGHGMMYGTAPYGFWRMGLTRAGTPIKYTPSNAEFLCSIDAQYPGGFAYIPSGSYKDSVLLSDYSNDQISLLSLDANGLCINATSGLGELGTSNPKIETFATDVENAWGFFFDPVTNDFFATSWSASHEVYHFTGFPPGVSMSVLFANLAAAIAEIQLILNPARRRLDGVRKIRNNTNQKTNKSPTEVVNNEPISTTKEIAADPARRRLHEVRGLGKKSGSTTTTKKSKKKKEEVVDVSGNFDILLL
mmetsp:Transcript_24396/g.34049  ORF Transcript_24396/g.34049 Transcript_24396/m.34049 type:complete len:434 (-) Transcript_24396:46-1347(-)